MQKIRIIFLLLLFSPLAKSQDSTDFTLNNIKQYATNIEAFLSTINSNLQADRHVGMQQPAACMKLYADSIEEEMEYLPDDYYYRFNTLVSAYQGKINELAALTLKQEFLGKGKLLATSVALLQQQQSSLRAALDAAYESAIQQQALLVNKQGGATGDTTIHNSNVVFVEAEEQDKITTSNNVILLPAIHEAQQQIEQCIDSIHLAMNSNDFNSIGVQAKNISNASLKISDLALLLKTDQKESLYILAAGLKNLSETLHQLTYKGIAAQNEMQECIDKIAIKYNTLSTGISLVQ